MQSITTVNLGFNIELSMNDVVVLNIQLKKMTNKARTPTASTAFKRMAPTQTEENLNYLRISLLETIKYSPLPKLIQIVERKNKRTLKIYQFK